MTAWIGLAIAAQLLNAVVALVDKYIVTSDKALPQPFVYAFYVCLLSGASIVIYLFSGVPVPLEGVHFPSISKIEFPTLDVVAYSFLAAYTFFLALVSLFTALRTADASDVIPVVGAVSAFATFGLGYLFLGARLSPNFFIGLVLLGTGTFLVSQLRFPARTAFTCVHAGVFFGLHYVTFKGLFEITSFDNGFFWSRFGFVLVALTLVLVPTYYEKIREKTKTINAKTSFLVILSKILAGGASILILKATELGDAAIVQALGGLQFVFLLFIGFVIGTRRAPIECGEDCRRMKVRDFVHKAAFISIITLGFFMLFV